MLLEINFPISFYLSFKITINIKWKWIERKNFWNVILQMLLWVFDWVNNFDLIALLWHISHMWIVCLFVYLFICLHQFCSTRNFLIKRLTAWKHFHCHWQFDVCESLTPSIVEHFQKKRAHTHTRRNENPLMNDTVLMNGIPTKWNESFSLKWFQSSLVAPHTDTIEIHSNDGFF